MNITRIDGNISSIVFLSSDEKLLLVNYMEEKTISKNELLLKEGQICDFIGFINSGVLIYSKILDNGDEVTTDFAFEGEWVADNYSRLKKSPSLLNIKAIEKTQLLIIKEKDLSELYVKLPKLEKLGRLLMEQAFVKMTRFSLDLQTLSAKERYLKLIHEYPETLKRIPLYHIANYLGIAPKSLSRIRNTIFDNG